jgi:hypothetical protein
MYRLAWMTGMAAGLATIMAAFNARWLATIGLGLVSVGCVVVAVRSRPPE